MAQVKISTKQIPQELALPAGGGMTQKGVNEYKRKNPGSKLKTAVTTPPSKLKKVVRLLVDVSRSVQDHEAGPEKEVEQLVADGIVKKIKLN